MKSILYAITILLINNYAWADGIDALHGFIASTHTARADFSQTVYDRHHVVRQQSSGTMEFSRPGKFRWVYQTPYQQVIVGDGKKIWLYDVDLAQVTERNLGDALGSSPAALLAGDNAIDTHYTLVNNGEHDGLTWLLATPKDSSGTFQSIRLGFKGDELVALDIQDNFGATTDLRLSHLQHNPKLPASNFQFIAPAGVDVLVDTPS